MSARLLLAITSGEPGIAPETNTGDATTRRENSNYLGNRYNPNHRHSFSNNRPNAPRPARPTNTNAPTSTLVSKFKGSVKEMNGHVFQCYEGSTAKSPISQDH